MGDTLRYTMEMLRNMSACADVKSKRHYSDFLADKITQSATSENLLGFVEALSGLLNVEIGKMGDGTIGRFLRSLAAPDAPCVLEWLRDYPAVAAMLCMLKREDFDGAIEVVEIDIPEGPRQKRGVAIQSRKPSIPLAISCLSPLAHGGDHKAGNATVFRRCQVLSDTGAVLSLPYYAGNAIRGILRDILADHYLSALGLIPRKDDPPCKLWFFHALYAGGALEEGSAQGKALAKILGDNGAVKAGGMHDLRNMIPPMSLLGSALGNRIISGRINVCDCRPRCVEWGTGDVPSGRLYEWTLLTRREDHEGHADGDHHGMIATSECLRAGTILDGGIDVSLHATPIERSCLAHGLNLMQQSGWIGAENRRGLGQVSIDIGMDEDGSLYCDYLAQEQGAILRYLEQIGAINASSELDLGIDQ